MKTKLLAAGMFLLGSTVLAACAPVVQSESSFSRAEIYSSVEDLSIASAVVITGQVLEQRVAQDIDDTPFTISTVQITETIKGDVAVGATVEVRQLGGGEEAAPTPLLSAETDYLLYLTPSGLPEPLDSQYYVTGANAGIYAADADVQARSSELTYTQVDPEPGEQLPETLSIEDVTNALP